MNCCEPSSQEKGNGTNTSLSQVTIIRFASPKVQLILIDLSFVLSL